MQSHAKVVVIGGGLWAAHSFIIWPSGWRCCAGSARSSPPARLHAAALSHDQFRSNIALLQGYTINLYKELKPHGRPAASPSGGNLLGQPRNVTTI